jgi:signal transduction histidine kinase
MPRRDPDPERWAAIDRPLGWLIALGGCVLVLDQTVFVLDEVAGFAPWWNAGALLVIAGMILLGALGRRLSRPVLTGAWVALPALYLALQATWVVGYRGGDLGGVIPWLWTVEPAVISLLLLTLRPAVAVGVGFSFSLVPALAGLLAVGHVTPAVVMDTPSQLGNVVYAAIIIGLRRRLERLHAGEREAARQRQRQVSAAARLQQHAELARFVHDEVLSALSAGMHADGAPSETLRRGAREALDALGSPTRFGPAEEARLTGEDAIGELVAQLRGIDDGFALETDGGSGDYPGRVVRGLALAAGEALRNSVRHAGAAASRRVRITVADGLIRVSVRDDGVGFVRDPASPRLGVQGSIVDRMEELGGSATIDSAPGQGTEVVLVVRPAPSPGHTTDLPALTGADTGAGGLGTALARWAFVFVWATGSVLQAIVDGSLAAAPLEWGVALVAGLIGALLLTTPGPLPLPPSRVVWLPAISLLTAAVALRTADGVGWVPALVFAVYLVAFLIPRGNAVAGFVGSALLIGSGLAWALPQQPSAAAVAEMLGIPVGCVAVGVVWRLVVRYVVGRERAHRGAAARSAERAEAAAEAIATSRAELAAISDIVVPVLERVADGEPIDEELRIELTHAEAAVRDRIRVPHLQHPLLVAEISRLRRLGVAVVLLGESSAPDQLIDERLAESCRALIAPVTSGRVTIRALPANRAAALSLVVHSGEAAIRAQWSADGEPVTAG